MFLANRSVRPEDGEWRPSKSQMSRDMKTLFGSGWTSRRGSGGRVASGKSAMHGNPGLTFPENARHLLEPNRKPTTLTSLAEHKVLQGLNMFEEKFGCGIITHVLFSSVAQAEVLAQLPELSEGSDVAQLWSSEHVQSKLNMIIGQLQSICQELWLKSFMNRHKNVLRKVERYRALEQHKAANTRLNWFLATFATFTEQRR